jgi:cytoskeletal protein RodZ
MNDEKIRQILREGDPFAGEAGLTPEEVREMRRTALTAIPERRERRLRLLPALALAGAAAVAVLIAFLALRQAPGGTPKPAPPRMAAVPEPVAPVSPPSAPVASPVPRAETRTVRPRHHRRPVAPRPPKTADAVASLEKPRESEGTALREIQFTTPGGTRILWTVVPGKASY